MKIRVTLKDPDTMQDAVDDAVKRLPCPAGIEPEEWPDIQTDRAQKAKSLIADRWMAYGEYLTVEFDTIELTATVVQTD